MAKTETASEADGGAKGGGKKKLILIIVGLVLLLGIGGGTGWFFLHKKGDHQVAAKPKPATPPVFVTLEPFVVNLAGEVQHYLQVGIDLKVADGHVGDAIKQHLPEIRNGVLLLLSSKQIEELGTLEGKNQLRQEIRAAVNKPLGIASPAATPAPAPAADAHAADNGSGGAAADAGSGAAHAAEKPAAEPAGDESPQGVLDVLLTSFVIQ